MPKFHLDSQTHVGRKFGRLVVSGWYRGKKYYFLICQCDCGTEKDIREDHVLSGRVVSCGCYKDYNSKIRMTKHGYSDTRTHNIWLGIIQRCNNPNVSAYRLYGGRGIAICDRWLLFENFLADMGECPVGNYCIDRYPNKNGNYEPGNCRWTTQKENCRNMITNRNISYDGETKCLSAWAEEIGIDATVLSWRIKNWGIEKALTKKAKLS